MLEAIIGEEEEGAVDVKEAEKNLEEKEEVREKICCTSCEVYLYSRYGSLKWRKSGVRSCGISYMCTGSICIF